MSIHTEPLPVKVLILKYIIVYIYFVWTEILFVYFFTPTLKLLYTCDSHQDKIEIHQYRI